MSSNIKFLVKREWKGTGLLRLQTKFMALMLQRKLIYKIVHGFKEGIKYSEDDPRTGRAVTKKKKKTKTLKLLIFLQKNVARSLDISYGSINLILPDNLRLSKISARWIPKALRPDRLVLRSDLSLAILNNIEVDEEHFLNRIIKGDETWI